MAKTKTVTTTFSTKGGSLTKAHTLTVDLLFNLDTDPILDWATAERKIAFQRVLRTKADDFVSGLETPYKLRAIDAGRNIVTPAERVNELVASGIPQKMAEMLVYQPDKMAEFEKMLTTPSK